MFILLERPARAALAVAAAAAALAVAPPARAVDCNTLPNPLYGLGGSAQRPLIARVAARLAAAASPITVVFQAPGACNGINALIARTAVTGEASYWTAAGTEQQCTLPVTGQQLDFANMGNTATSCPGVSARPADIGDFTGPVTTWNFLVPVASSQQSISAAGAYFVFGFGNQSMAAPWTDETAIIRRDANSAATLFVSLATGVPPDRFLGVDARTNAGSVTLLSMAANPEAAIGYASGEVADGARSQVRTLAYQHTDQRCGYWPDSSPTAFDKRNVRTGLYWLWSPTHFFARTDAAGHIANPRTATFVGLFTGETTIAGIDMLDLSIRNGNIPRCAMNVWRTGDLGPLVSYQPEEPCGCFFDQVATGASTCTPCTDSTACAATPRTPVCRRGFCEVR